MIHALTLLGMLHVRRALRRPRAAAGPRLDPVRRRLEHGRVAGDRADLETDLRRPPGVVGDIPADDARRPHGGGGGRHGHGGAAVHSPRQPHHDGVAGDAGVHRGRPPAHPAGQDHSGLRGDLPHPRSVPVWSDRQAARHRAPGGFAAAGRHPAPAQHDGHRWHRPERDRRAGRGSAREGTHAGDLRRAGATVRRAAARRNFTRASATRISARAFRPRSIAPRRSCGRCGAIPQTAHRSARTRRAGDGRPRPVPPTPCIRSSRSPACRRTGTA